MMTVDSEEKVCVKLFGSVECLPDCSKFATFSFASFGWCGGLRELNPFNAHLVAGLEKGNRYVLLDGDRLELN